MAEQSEHDEFKPNWQLSPKDKLAVALTLSLSKHVPGWTGATDEELGAVAADVLASDPIAALEAEVTLLGASVTSMQRQINELEAERARLREALEPFADIPSVSLFPEGGMAMAKHYWAVIGTPDRSHFTQSDLVRARAALSAPSGQPGESA